jgi:transposase
VICIDEITLHKGNGQYILVISAPELGLVLDVLHDRTKETLVEWLIERGKAWCEQVEVVCSDMWGAYQTAALQQLPHAQRVIDRFHVMKNLNDALSKARRTIQKTADATTQTLLKGSRWLIVKNSQRLTETETHQLQQILSASTTLNACYTFKESFRALFDLHLDLHQAEQRLLAWITAVESSGVLALQTFARTLRHWWQPILNYFVGRHTNGFAEGINLKLKALNRRAYGYRSFHSFRLHALLAFSRLSR